MPETYPFLLVPITDAFAGDDVMHRRTKVLLDFVSANHNLPFWATNTGESTEQDLLWVVCKILNLL